MDAAHHLASLRLAAGDADGARKAARIAQKVDRYDERPWRDLMEAEHLAGNVHRQLRDELMKLVESEVEDELMPETQELLQRLLPRERRLAIR